VWVVFEGDSRGKREGRIGVQVRGRGTAWRHCRVKIYQEIGQGLTMMVKQEERLGDTP